MELDHHWLALVACKTAKILDKAIIVSSSIFNVYQTTLSLNAKFNLANEMDPYILQVPRKISCYQKKLLSLIIKWLTVNEIKP